MTAFAKLDKQQARDILHLTRDALRICDYYQQLAAYDILLVVLALSVLQGRKSTPFLDMNTIDSEWVGTVCSLDSMAQGLEYLTKFGIVAVSSKRADGKFRITANLESFASLLISKTGGIYDSATKAPSGAAFRISENARRNAF